MIEYFIKTYSNEGDVVMDNCMGSGSTCIACINTNRQYIGIENSAEYYEKADEWINKTTNNPLLNAMN
jgi:site-specific DNA-methyltransferase (adenine-specific)